jgi:hypothetical protein
VFDNYQAYNFLEEHLKMRRNSYSIAILLIISGLLLSACGQIVPTEDPNAQITQIAMTVQAQLTAIGLLTPSATPTIDATATPTPIPATDTPSGPTLTPTKTPYPTYDVGSTTGDHSIFAKDITIPDGTVFTPGTAFTKTWLFTNSGSTTWTTDYKLVYIDGTATGANNSLSVNLPNEVKPGESVEISVNFVAPSSNGSYNSWWKLYSASGILFGDPCSVVFSVGATASTSAPTLAITATP